MRFVKCRNNRPFQIKVSAMYKAKVARQDKRLISITFLPSLIWILGEFSDSYILWLASLNDV